MGDTLEMTLTIENTGKDTLIVWDPDIFNPRIAFGKIENEYFIYADIGRYYDGEIYLEGVRLRTLYPKESVQYPLNYAFDSETEIDSAVVMDIELGSICWQYSSSMECTRIVDERYIYMDSLDIAAELLINSRRTILGRITIVVFDKPERIITE